MQGIVMANVQLRIIDGTPCIVTKEAVPDDIAREIHEWMSAIRNTTRNAWLLSEDAAYQIEHGTRRSETFETTGALRDGVKRIYETDKASDHLPPASEHGVTVRVGGAFSDITQDGFVIECDDKVARGIVHAIGHLVREHEDMIPLLLLASVLGSTEPGREFEGLAKIADELVKQGVENVEVGGAPVVRR